MLAAEQAMPLALERLKGELTKAGPIPEDAFFGVFPGVLVPLDYVTECGLMAWVRMATAWPSTSFPNQSIQPNNCAAPLALGLEMGVMRPAAVPEAFGKEVSLPSDVDQLSETLQMLADMRAMKRAIQSLDDQVDVVLLGGYTPLGPEGAAVGGIWTFSAGEI